MPSFPFQKGCIDFFDKHTTLVGPAQKVYFINHLDEFVIAKALWLSWLKRLSSKQEITGSNPVSAYFSFFFFFFFFNDRMRIILIIIGTMAAQPS